MGCGSVWRGGALLDEEAAAAEDEQNGGEEGGRCDEAPHDLGVARLARARRQLLVGRDETVKHVAAGDADHPGRDVLRHECDGDKGALEAFRRHHSRVLVQSGRPDRVAERHEENEDGRGAVGGPSEGERAEGLYDGAADEALEGRDSSSEKVEGDGEGEEHGHDGLDGHEHLEGSVIAVHAHKVLGEGGIEVAECGPRSDGNDQREAEQPPEGLGAVDDAEGGAQPRVLAHIGLQLRNLDGYVLLHAHVADEAGGKAGVERHR